MSDWITFGNGRKGRRSWDTDQEKVQHWQRLLAEAHGADTRPHCDCVHDGRHLELVVRRGERLQGDRVVEAYHVARFPGQGALHQVTCPFHETDARRNGRGGYEEGVVREMANGDLRVALRRGLRIRDGAVAPPATAWAAGDPRHGAGGPPRQARMTELGLLHLLWERAGLNTWRPDIGRRRRWWTGVRQALAGAANGVLTGRGQHLGDRLAMVGYGDHDGVALLRRTARECADTWRILLLGVVDSVSLRRGRQDTDFVSVGFDGAAGYDLRVSMPRDWSARLARRFPMAMAALSCPRGERPIRVVGLVTASVRIGRDGEHVRIAAWADDMALMEVEPDTLVPVASHPELTIATALVRGRRAFIKPLRYDAHRDVVHPDFVLTDTADRRGAPMEVFGRDDEAYAARREEKARYYNAVYGRDHWWCWNAVAAPRAIPPFPPAA
ncbi:DUF1173 family protein [Komagataeibacter sp. FNDCR2]|uniref:DUF1173 family protein n=1 Tax=Komagataeibacter sp. FNDCR2 TaxID=2878682 RepID=UPI001E32097A|nr:DUF1173 family protein [Komagataeibacter sp. FNDCR2]MCE2576736.1 DUF1173 domain-containing protein [Komagataeibacter sp. FNDCR2]